MNPYLTFVDDQIFYLRNPYNFLDEKPVPRRLRGGRRTEVKPTNLLGRNDPCHCGSGVKYKKCCLNKSDEK